MTMYTIYGLVDPRTFMIRYIGISQNHPSVRLIAHLERKDKATRKNLWLDGLRALNVKPALVILDFAPDLETARDKEQWWIRHGITNGWELTNGAHTAKPRKELRSTCDVGNGNGTEPSTQAPQGGVGLTALQEKIVEYFRDNPGAGVNQAARDLGISKSHVSKTRATIAVIEYYRRNPDASVRTDEADLGISKTHVSRIRNEFMDPINSKGQVH